MMTTSFMVNDTRNNRNLKIQGLSEITLDEANDELDGDVEGQLFVKPSKEHPVWVCIGLTVDLRRCVEAMCDNCAQQMPDYSEIRMHVL
jgi:hypothetical protein